MIRRVFLDRRVRFLVVSALILAAGMGIEIYPLPHYVAPFMVVFYAIGLQAMRHLRFWKPEGKPVGRTITRLMMIACVFLAVVRVFAVPLRMNHNEWPPSNWNFVWFGPERFGTERAQIEAKLESMPGPQLALVRYASCHEVLDEWVYNSANIDASRVVWAREMDPANNRELMQYYRDRKVWLVEPDRMPAQMLPYPIAETAAGNANPSETSR
jgi:hypothetical protein